MATKPAYTAESTLTPAQCRTMLAAVLGLDEAAADAEIQEAYDAKMAEMEAEAEPAEEEVVEDETVVEEPEAPAPKRAFKGSAMTIMTRPRK